MGKSFYNVQVFLIAVLGLSVDCPNLINLASSLNVSTKQSAIWTALNIDCCATSGVICASQRVTELDWHSLNLDGIFNETALPSNLKVLALWGNKLTGNIPTIFPSGLTRFDVGGNEMTGTISANFPNSVFYLSLYSNNLSGKIPSKLPTGLIALDVRSCQLSGDLPVFPIALQNFHGSGNFFTGTLTLKVAISFEINDNMITDIQIQDITNLQSCDISNNPLLGNPRIPRLSACSQTGLYSITTTFRPVVAYTITSREALHESSAKPSFEALPVETTSQITTSTEAPVETTPQITTSPVVFNKTQKSNETRCTSIESAATQEIVHFTGKYGSIVVNINFLIHLTIDAMITSGIIVKMPFLRELRALFRRKRNLHTDEISLN